jgi:hypothetical protein
MLAVVGVPVSYSIGGAKAQLSQLVRKRLTKRSCSVAGDNGLLASSRSRRDDAGVKAPVWAAAIW